MGIKERRAQHKENLRQSILDTARTLFATEGYTHVSMRKIAAQIAHSPTAIYLYFENKAALLNCLCDETFASLVGTFEALAQDAHGDPLVLLREGLYAYVDFGCTHPHHYVVTFLGHPDHRYPLEGSMGERAFHSLRTTVEQCVAQQKFRAVDVDVTAQALWAAVHGVTMLLIGLKDFPFVTPETLISSVIDTMLTGLKA